MLTEHTRTKADQIAKLLELVGVVIIVGGIILATLTFVREGSRTGDWRSASLGYRSDIGRGILLGLELLVVADIISTITAPLLGSARPAPGFGTGRNEGRAKRVKRLQDRIACVWRHWVSFR